MKTKLAAGFAVCTLLVASACGGGRPSQSEIADAMLDNDNEAASQIGGGLDQGSADCAAEVLHESDLSDETLRALVDGDEDYEPSDEEAEDAAFQDLAEDFFACIAGDLDVPELEDSED